MLDLFRILLRWHKPLIGATVLAAVLAAVISFQLAPRYFSQASILPPADNNPAFGGISALLSQYSMAVPGGIDTPFLPTLYASMITSRKMAVHILDEFDLRPVFGTKLESDAIVTLRKRTMLKYTDENILLVGYEDEDAERAAAVANSYVRNLDRLIQENNSSRAGDTRRFIETQVQRCMADLKRAEEELRDFQAANNAIEIETQATGVLEIAGQMQGRIMAAEVELDLLRQYGRPESYEVRAKEAQLKSLEDSYARLLDGNELPKISSVPGAADASGAATKSSMLPGISAVPELALDYMRLFREVKVQTTLYTMLLQQLETARIEEQKNTRVISVLDWATAGEIPVFPKKLRLIVVAALVAFAWVALFAVFVERLRERRESAVEVARLAALRREWDRMPSWVRSIEKLVVK